MPVRECIVLLLRCHDLLLQLHSVLIQLLQSEAPANQTGNRHAFTLRGMHNSRLELVYGIQPTLPGIGRVPLQMHQLIATWAGVLPPCFCPTSLMSCIKGWTS